MERVVLKILMLMWVATESACLQEPPQRPIVLEVVGHADGCQITMDGRAVASDEKGKIEGQSAERRGIVVVAENTPKGCIDRAVAELRTAGIGTIDVVRWYGKG